MQEYKWTYHLARDVLMNICQRRVQNARREANKLIRQQGGQVPRGRPKRNAAPDLPVPRGPVLAQGAVALPEPPAPGSATSG
jgi:hypothetical protein